MDYEKFYKEHIPRSHLPSDYGGSLASVDELHKKSCQKLMDLKDYFIFEEQQANFEFDDLVDEHLNEFNSK